jgi:hypothetical protein
MAYRNAVSQILSRFWLGLARFFTHGNGLAGSGLSLQQALNLDRRFRIVATFLAIWAFAIVAETANFSFLAHLNGTRSHGVFSSIVFMIGISLQIIFQGPTRLEIMERLRSKSGKEPPKIDRIYLSFYVSRAIRVAVVLTVFPIIAWLAGMVAGTPALMLVTTSALICLIAGLRALVTRSRVLAGQFGSTQYEARQLLSFLSKLHAPSKKPPVPPGTLTPLFEETVRVVVPHDAEVAL